MKVDINNIKWEIISVPSFDTRLYFENKKANGACEYATKKIIIDNQLSKDVQICVLRHELVHAFIDSFLLEQKDNYSEEEIAEFVALYAQQICCIANKYFS